MARMSRPHLLQAELQATRERLQEMVVELQASHERIDLSNEELTASNEELQSANEELKSVNEDLYALNRELEAKNEELAALNRDYDHLLDSTDIGTVFLDAQTVPASHQPRGGGLSGPAPSMTLAGPWPISAIAWARKRPFWPTCSVVRARGARIEREVRLPDGRWVFQRMLPFKEEQERRRRGADLDRHQRGQTHAAPWPTSWPATARADGHHGRAARRGVHHQPLATPSSTSTQCHAEGVWPVQGRKCYEYFHGRSRPVIGARTKMCTRAKQCIGSGPIAQGPVLRAVRHAAAQRRRHGQQAGNHSQRHRPRSSAAA
jgi:PAS domain-containing protein